MAIVGPLGVLGTVIAGRVVGADERLLDTTGPLTTVQVRRLVVMAADSQHPRRAMRASVRLTELPGPALRAVLNDIWNRPGGCVRQRAVARRLYAQHWPSEAMIAVQAEWGHPATMLDDRLDGLGLMVTVPAARQSGVVADMLTAALASEEPPLRDLACNLLRTYTGVAEGRSIRAEYAGQSARFVDLLRAIRRDDTDFDVRTHANSALHVLTEERTPDVFRVDHIDRTLAEVLSANPTVVTPAEAAVGVVASKSIANQP